MSYLAVFIAIITLSCRADDLDLRSDPAGGTAEPVPCLSLCKDACDAYGDWSEWLPKTDTECESKQFTQSSSRTRKCPRANNLCDGITCPTEEKKTWKIYGTKKDCTDPPDPQCKQCDGCGTWVEGEVISTEGECNSKSFNKHSITHNQKRTRVCSENCLKQDCNTEETQKMKEECPYCEGTGQKLINKGKDSERCECDEDRGFVKKGNECVCKEGYALNAKGDACEEERKEERTCADFCTKPWGNWGEWDIPENKRCPTTKSFDKPSLTAEIATRERTRVCENNTLGCFTINVETHITPCTYCEGDDRKIIHAGTNEEECICKEEDRFYRDGDECVECESPSEISGGECIEQEEEQEIETESEEADEDETDTDTDTNTDTNTDIDIEPESEPEPEPEEEQQTEGEQQTEEQTCADFSCEATWSSWSEWTIEGNSCPVSSSFDKSDLTEEQKTRTRTRDCGNDPLGCFFTSNTETHITSCTYCEGNDRKIVNVGTDDEACVCDCSKKFYKDNGACAECNTTTHKLVLQKNGSCQCVALPPEPEGEGEVDTNSDGEQEREIETPADECPPNKIRIKGKCVCDEDNHYYYDEKKDTCVECKGEGFTWTENNKCVEGGREKAPEKRDPSAVGTEPSTEDGTSEKETQDPPCTTCAECSWDEWPNGGAFTFSDANMTCPAPEVFALPIDQPEKKRTRSRTCNNVCEGIQCFTQHEETETCAWCQGEGQMRKGKGCVCDKNANYYKDTSDVPHRCVSCNGRIVNSRGDGCVCKGKKYYHSEYSDLDIGKANAPSWLHADYDTDLGTEGNCLCDRTRDYIPNRDNEGQLLGGCVCRNQHEEITEGGVKKCRPCGKQDLREVSKDTWKCVTCGLAELQEDSRLHAPGNIGVGQVGKECYCATHRGDGSVRNTDVVVNTINSGNADLAAFKSWWHSLSTWYDKTAQRIRDSIKPPPEPDENYAGAMLWSWYLDARRVGSSLYPPLPEAWKTLHQDVTGKVLRDDSDLRYITCTVFTWLADD